MKGISGIALLAIPFAFAANAQVATSNTPAKAGENGDATFVQKAGEGGMAEVELSKVAESNAKSADVKKFATQMVHDHSANNKELATIAAKENIRCRSRSIPNTPHCATNSKASRAPTSTRHTWTRCARITRRWSIC